MSGIDDRPSTWEKHGMTFKEYMAERSLRIEAALAQRAGLANLEAHYEPDVLNHMEREFPGGLSLHDAMKIACQDRGVQIGALSGPIDLYNGAFRDDPMVRELRATAGFSTVEISGILSNVANKLLYEAWNGVDRTWRDIAAVRSVDDFRGAPTYALAGNFEYELIGNDGEVKSANLGETSYNNQADQYGKSVLITRRDWISDDLAAFSDAARMLGRGAAQAINRRFYTVFLGAVGTMFTSGHNNLLTGGSSALSATSLGSAIALFSNQTDPNGEPVALPPRTLLVPPLLTVPAYSIVHELMVASGTTGTDPSDQVEGPLAVRSSPYLSNTNYSGSSSTAWYVLARAQDLATMQTVFLQGKDMPTIDRAGPHFETLGIALRGVHDFGCATLEYRAGVRSAGA